MVNSFDSPELFQAGIPPPSAFPLPYPHIPLLLFPLPGSDKMNSKREIITLSILNMKSFNSEILEVTGEESGLGPQD